MTKTRKTTVKNISFKPTSMEDKLAEIFMDTESEGEFEGFSLEDFDWKKPLSEESEEDATDNGFYSDGEEAEPKSQRRSGLCVAFSFPVKRNMACKRKTSKKCQAEATPTTHRPGNRTISERLKKVPISKSQKKILTDVRNVEDLLNDEEMQILKKRNKNIEENKAMLAKLFADLNSLPEPSTKTTPTKKKNPSASRPRRSDAQIERRNPSRKARPPENFGKEERPSPPRRESRTINIQHLMEVHEGLLGTRPKPKKRRCRESIRKPEDITREELENIAVRASDKILDKDHGSTCHQCRQKTLDTKTECRGLYCCGVKGQFCGPCLRNRYGEDVQEALLDPLWQCPICRGVCNCSLCRKRDGRCATGALTRLAKFYGHDNVKEYLESLQKSTE